MKLNILISARLIAFLFYSTFCLSKDELPAMVDIQAFIPSVHTDVRYATSRNFLQKPVYKKSAVYVQSPLAESLARVQASLLKKGYSLLLYDGYRPLEVSKLFWDSASEKQRPFLTNPDKIISSHNCGAAVDIGLWDIKKNREVSMPCPYDEMSERASIFFSGGDREARFARYLLFTEMESQGFKGHTREWWHYEYPSCKKACAIPNTVGL